MLSIIVSSQSSLLIQNLENNIRETIGDTPYELRSAENAQGKKGICRVYNELAAGALYPCLLFVHEDVFFHSSGWGSILVRELADHNTGLIGLVGGDTVSKVPSGWSKQDKQFNLGRIFQSAEEVINRPDQSQQDFETAVALDGVFLACRQTVWEEFRFNELLLPGFHGYDLEFSLSVGQKYTVKVCNLILLEHFSTGSFSKEWVNAMLVINKKWDKNLPISVHSALSAAGQADMEYWQAVLMLQYTKEKKMNAATKWYIFCQFCKMRHSRVSQIVKLLKYVV